MIGHILKHPIRACHDGDSLIVYQAFEPMIGVAAATRNTLEVPGFSMSRMTWIKPSFLWMMYRSGWGQKDSRQTCVLSIRMKIQALITLLENATLSNFHDTENITDHEWKESLKRRRNRVQWDPDRDIWLTATDQRAIQIGIAPEFLDTYLKSIVEINDITNFCKRIERDRHSVERGMLGLPVEREITFD